MHTLQRRVSSAAFVTLSNFGTFINRNKHPQYSFSSHRAQAKRF